MGVSKKRCPSSLDIQRIFCNFALRGKGKWREGEERIFIDKYIFMRYKTLVLSKLEQADAVANRLQFEINRGHDQEQLLESVEQLKMQLEEIRSMVSIEHDSFEQQFTQ